MIDLLVSYSIRYMEMFIVVYLNVQSWKFSFRYVFISSAFSSSDIARKFNVFLNGGIV